MEKLNNRLDVDEVTSKIETYKAEIKFPSFHVNTNDIQTFIHQLSNHNFLKTLSSTEIREKNITLSYYLLFLTSEENRLKSFINWCEGNIKMVVGKRLKDIDAYSFAEKDQYIRAEEPIVADLENAKSLAQVKLDMIQFIPNRIQFLIEKLESLAFERARQHKVH